MIFDCGAHVGFTSIWFATRYPHARIIAVEPEGSNYDLLVQNVTPFSNVTAVQAALWSHSGVVAIDDPGSGTWGFQPTRLERVAHPVATVESLTVNDVMDRFGFEHVDLLKIDIEGAENEVFSDTGATKWIDSVGVIEVELHDRFRPGCSRAFFSRVGDFGVEITRGMNTFVARDA